MVTEFFAYAANFTGGVNVAAGDFNNDGKADMILGTALAVVRASGPHVRVLSAANLSELASFLRLLIVIHRRRARRGRRCERRRLRRPDHHARPRHRISTHRLARHFTRQSAILQRLRSILPRRRLRGVIHPPQCAKNLEKVRGPLAQNAHFLVSITGNLIKLVP